ncbi:MAG: 30S ribosomal protein S7 [Ardenticatenales bacterium]|nr:30S ribosomal protein S7 [Ardenticatenales bacterium]MCB9171947.1 30S ribosomal protein S7 [Ardenticatenales bacterium]
MPRRGQAPKRKIEPDPRYGNETLARFINKMMVDGKKSLAQRIVYDALDSAAERLNVGPEEVFEQALRNVTPLMEVRPRRVGGSTYQVPMEIRADRRRSLGLRWLVTATRNRSGRSTTEKLANELMDAFNNSGAAVRRKEEVHRMAEANKAYSHFRW